MSPLLFASDIELPRDPVDPMHAATKQYVDTGLAKKADLKHKHAVEDVTGLGTAAKCDTGTAEGNVPVIGSTGMIDMSLIPALTISDTFTAATEADMLALTAQKGDVCIRTDTSETYILSGDDPKVKESWTKLLAPTDAVQSVNGKTGVITLTAEDVGAVAKSSLGTANGMAALDENGKVPVAQIPTQDTVSDDPNTVPTGAAVFAHIKETNAHSATSVPTADRIAMYAANNCLKSSTPVADDDVATKAYVDAHSSGGGSFRIEITGNGSKTEFAVDHNLKNSEVDVRVYKKTAEKLIPIFTQWVPTTENQVTLSFALAPAAEDAFVVKVVN